MFGYSHYFGGQNPNEEAEQRLQREEAKEKERTISDEDLMQQMRKRVESNGAKRNRTQDSDGSKAKKPKKEKKAEFIKPE